MALLPNSRRIEGLSSWISCRQHFLFKSRRYFTLSSQVLSCFVAPVGSENKLLHNSFSMRYVQGTHADISSLFIVLIQGSHPKWELDCAGAYVSGDQPSLRITVRSHGPSVKLYFDTEHTFSNWLAALQTSATRRVDDQYQFGPSIGKGVYAEVIMAVDKCTFEQYAIKVIHKIHDDPQDKEYIWRELKCMSNISHPNVVKMQNVFDTRDKLYVVLDYMPGGSLKKLFAKCNRFSEGQTKSVVKDILQGTAYLHEMSIVHRDIKMENVLCTAKEFPFTAKIADFALATFLEAVHVSKAGLQSQVGSPFYIAPEILREDRYGALVDSWSIGVMMYIMLTRRYPFAGATVQETLEQIVLGHVHFDERYWKSISVEAQNLVRGLLCEDVSERLSPQQALADPWFCIWTDKKPLRRSGRIPGACCNCNCEGD